MRDKKVEVPALGDAEDVARIFGVLRLGIGVATMIAPSFVSKVWLGRGAEDTSSRVGMRGLGGREAAIGLGTLLALEHDRPVRGWIEAGALADAADAFGVVAQRKSLPAARWMLAAGIAAASAWFCTQLAAELGE
ncbi:MAG TPA: hypothetical protein VG318_00235 [Actinomycetota bacterium]|nr:hypothetical protein [Actinomycetota bacterium]